MGLLAGNRRLAGWLDRGSVQKNDDMNAKYTLENVRKIKGFAKNAKKNHKKMDGCIPSVGKT